MNLLDIENQVSSKMRSFPKTLNHTSWELKRSALRWFFLFIRIHVLPHVRFGLQICCETSVQNRKKKKRSKFVFSCKNGLKSWWTELSYCTCSPLLTYTITECLTARSGFARSCPIYCHLYATILLMPTAYRHSRSPDQTDQSNPISELTTKFWPRQLKIVPGSLPYGENDTWWLNSFIFEFVQMAKFIFLAFQSCELNVLVDNT